MEIDEDSISNADAEIKPQLLMCPDTEADKLRMIAGRNNPMGMLVNISREKPNVTMTCMTRKVPVTDQEESGRCWIFATLAIVASYMGKIYSELGEEFQLSQAHLTFWDKLEKFNSFLVCIIQTAHLSVHHRRVSALLNRSICDGGSFGMVVPLIQKYGIMPKKAYGESFSSSNTAILNQCLDNLAKTAAHEIRQKKLRGEMLRSLHKIKEVYVQKAFNLQCIMLGVPPKEFDLEIGHTNIMRSTTTPLGLYEMIGRPLDDFVCVADSLRRVEGDELIVEYETSVHGKDCRYLVVDIENILTMINECIKEKTPVYVGVDNQYLHVVR